MSMKNNDNVILNVKTNYLSCIVRIVVNKVCEYNEYKSVFIPAVIKPCIISKVIKSWLIAWFWSGWRGTPAEL
jgi:hypothetical protein